MPADPGRPADDLPGHAELLASARVLHGHGDDRAGAGREEHRQQHPDVPGDVPVASGRRGALQGALILAACTTSRAPRESSRSPPAAVAVVALLFCDRARRQAPPRAGRPARGARRGNARIWSDTPPRSSSSSRRSTTTSRTSRPQLNGRMDTAEQRLDARGRLPRAGPLRRLRRDVRTPVDLDRAARRAALGPRAVLDPPPRPGAAVRQAGPRGPARARALPGGERGDPARPRRALAPTTAPRPSARHDAACASATSAPRGRSPRRR